MPLDATVSLPMFNTLRRKRRPGCSIAIACVVLLAGSYPSLHASSKSITVLELDNQIISPVTQEYIGAGIKQAEANRSECLILTLDTPGGLLESTRAIVKQIMNADIPIVVFVGPAGSRAGSAGVFITLAAHIAAMAPSTNIGAAHPVSVGGEKSSDVGILSKLFRALFGSEKVGRENSSPAQDENPSESKNPLEDKIMNDTLAWVSGIAKERNRNEQWAQQAVKESVSATSDEALSLNIIDLIATDLDDLIKQLNGRSVNIKGKTTVLDLADAPVISLSMTSRQKLLAHLTNPNLAYILMMLGTFGLIFEFTHPGIGFPGIAGLICLLLAFYAFQTLPVSLVAVALIILGVLLLIAEVLIVSHGMLGFGALISLTLGSLMLFDSPDPSLRVSWHVIWPTIATLGGLFFFLLRIVVTSRRNRIATGREALVGSEGIASTDIHLSGKIFAHGEYWNAQSETPIAKGSRVRITRVKELRTWVEPLNEDHH